MRWVPVALLSALLAVSVGSATASAQDAPCEPGLMPYTGLTGAALVPEVHASLDEPPVHYVRWRGFVPSFDGLPLSVDVTIPCGALGADGGAGSLDGALPTVLMAHGFTDDKTIWQETGKTDTIESADRPQANSRWNNIWFAARGYATINHTARGWRDSCGPDTPGATPATPAAECLPYAYWIHLDDKRWEVRDAQWLLGGLVQSGHADPERLAMTGGSYGGAPTLSAAMLADNVMCGGAPVPPALGVDACAGMGDGELAPWTTPDGSQRLGLVAAVPTITFADIVQVLAPNGRVTDGWEHAPASGDPTDPIGVPIHSTLAGLLAAGNVYGHFAPPGVDPTSDVVVDAARVLAGNPFPAADPILSRALDVYRRFKSPITTAPQGRVPIYWAHGLTDPLFPAWEPLAFLRMVKAVDPDYPIALFLGDFGHDYAAQRVDEGQASIVEMNAFLDHFLRPDRTVAPPVLDVTAAVTRCLDPDEAMELVSAPDWHQLHESSVTFASHQGGVTSTLVPGPNGLATDPISSATLPLPGAYRGCRIVAPAANDPTVVTYEFPVAEELVMMGGPVVRIAFTATGPDVPLSVRLWDVTPDGSAQGLVTRGTYRVVDAGPGEAEFQLAPQGYRFRSDHRIKLEVTANDSPYFQASNIPSVVTVESLELEVPQLTVPGSGAPVGQPNGGSEEPPATPATGGGALLGALLVAAAVITPRRGRRGPSGGGRRWPRRRRPA